VFTNCKHVKQRALPFPVNDFRIREGYRYVSPPQTWVMDPWSQQNKLHLGGSQITETDGNPWPLPKNSGKKDLGSEFYTQKKEIIAPTVMPYSFCEVKTYNPPGTLYNRAFEGSLVANCLKLETYIPGNRYSGKPLFPLGYNWPPDMSSSRHDLEVKGTTAITACAPGSPVANAASFLGELMQDVPKVPGIALWESRLRAAAAVAAGADEFLNYIFGIAPTIGDMGDFLKGSHKIDKVIEQFERDSGRVVRRGFHFPTEKSETEEVLPYTWSPAGWAHDEVINTGYCWIGAPNSGGALPVRPTVRKRTVERKQWFSGAFTYYLPSWYDSDSERDRRRLMAKLFGAEPDIATVWQLAPWSWAVDWFSNAGSYIKNLQSLLAYGTILRYGYMMETTTVTDTFTASGPYSSVGMAGLSQPYPYVAPVTLRVTTKKRVAASPFGFGLTWDSLSSVQKAIVAALGITRVVR